MDLILGTTCFFCFVVFCLLQNIREMGCAAPRAKRAWPAPTAGRVLFVRSAPNFMQQVANSCGKILPVLPRGASHKHKRTPPSSEQQCGNVYVFNFLVCSLLCGVPLSVCCRQRVLHNVLMILLLLLSFLGEPGMIIQ